MATIKAYTDLEQSKKLTEILPIESSDMLWGYYYNGKDYCVPNIRPFRDMHDNIPKGYTSAWSLAALLDILTENKICHYDGRHYCQYISEGDEFPIYSTAEYDNPIDACVEMITELHKRKML